MSSYKIVRGYAREMRKNPTPAEDFFWQRVRGRKFMGLKFNRQYVLEHSDLQGNRSYFIPDFHCFEKKLLVEIDGDIHLYQIKEDQIREELLKELGYHILRFTNKEVLENWEAVSQKLENFISGISNPQL